MSTFEFKCHHPEHGHVIARVESDNEREARAYVKTQIFCRKLSAREIIEVSQRGLAIVDAKTGEVIGRDVPEDDPDTAEKCESGDPSCGPVEHYDNEGVPLCEKCYDSLEPITNPPADDAE